MRMIHHETEIAKPIAETWAALANLKSWGDWNLYTLLDVEPRSGAKGTLKAYYEGDGKVTEFGFVLYEFDANKRIVRWGSKLGGGCIFQGNHWMQLFETDDGNTRLLHHEEFSGIVPALGLVLPYTKLDRNYLRINQAFKAHMEA